MRILGLSFGKRMGKCEILVKEALMEAEKDGAEVSFIRMIDLDIKPCTGCGGCFSSKANGGNGRCIKKDDLQFVDEELMNSDAIIVAAPVYVLGPTGLLKIVIDRFGPSHDLASLTMENEKRIAEGKNGDQLIDPRSFKQRYAGLMSVGGAMTQNWVSFGLPTMNLLCISSQIKVVDQIDAYDMGRIGNPVLNKELMSRVRELGHNVASAIGTPAEEVKWMGDEEGTCTVCHCNLITVNGTTTVECPVCGIYGKLTVEGDNVSVTFSAAEQKRSRLNFDGKLEHVKEIKSFGSIAGPKIKAAGDDLQKALEKYKGYKELNVPNKG